jgi:hypothetical protein
MADLGDLSEFLKEGAVSNLDWLDIDEAEYRKHETLPKQNLDVVPDLEAAWMHKDESPSIYAVPNVTPVPPFVGAGEIHTMGDMSEAHGRLRAKPEEIRKTARLALMQSTDLNRFKNALKTRYDMESLRAAKSVIAEVLADRGLLGKLYIDSNDFPGCHTGSAKAGQFAGRYAKEAKYVLAKPECSNCIHAMKGPTGGDLCSVFHKEIQVEVPYSDALAVEVEQMQKAKGKDVKQASGAAPKERVRLAMLADNFHAPGPAPMPKPKENVVRLMKPVQATAVLPNKKAQQVVAMMRREMLKGRGISEVVEALKVAFTQKDLADTREHWEPLFREGGLYGGVYSTQASFDDCREGADFLAKHNQTVRAMVAGEKCNSCIYNKISRCLIYGKPLVKDASALYTPEVASAVLLEGQTSGRLPQELKAASDYGPNPREQLKSMHRVASKRHLPVLQQMTRLDHVKAFHGAAQSDAKPVVNPIVAGVSRMLNEGLYGEDLKRAMKLRFPADQIRAAATEIRQVLAEQGLQGVFYVDPSVYDDYGKGCKEAERLHRTRLVEYAKVGSKCHGCVHQTQPGYCSVLAKKLVNEPPYYDKAAQQREILASGPATEVRFDQLVNNGLSTMVEFELQNRMSVEIDPVKTVEPVEIQLGKVAKRR